MLSSNQNTQAQQTHVMPTYLMITVGIGVVLTACLHMVKIMGMTFMTEASIEKMFLIWLGMLIASVLVLVTTNKNLSLET